VSSTDNDFSHCVHGSPIVETPPFSEKFELISGSLVEAVAEKYDARKDKANCHTYNKCKYIARKEYNEPPIFYLVGSAKPMPLCSGRWTAWRGGKENPHRPYADGGVTKKEILLSESGYSLHRLTHANPMPRKKEPPLTGDAKASEGEAKDG